MTDVSSARSWRMRLQLLREDLRADVASVGELRAVARRRPIFEELLADLDRQLDRSEAAAVITLVGATGAGKSTLLNAIARQEIAREGVDRPTTSAATVYAPRDADVSALVAGGADRAGAPSVVRYTPVDGESGAHVFVDAPDMNSVEPRHAELLRDLAQRSDVLLVVLHRQSVVEAAPVEFLDGFAERRALGFVLNRADELTDEAREALLAQLRRLVAERWNVGEAPILALSARRAKEEPGGADRRSLVEMVARLLGGRAIQRIRRHNALGTASMLASEFADVRDEVVADLAALPDDVAAGVETLATQIVHASEERWRLHRTDMNELLWAETARRWEGPGGWALRVGGVEAIGMGAAGALARSHPLLAVGTAVTAAAASGVRKVVQQRRLYEDNPMLPSGADLDAAHRAALAPVRIRVGRLCGDTDALGLPDEGETRAAVSAAVDSAWRTLIERDLPQAAERSSIRYVRWLLDLPVYGLVAWLVYRSVMGFAAGNYIGVDLLLNSGLLVVVYLVAVRLLVRAALRRRARRLLERASQGSRSGLEEWRDRVVENLRERIDALTATLGRLAQIDAVWLRKLGDHNDDRARP